MDFLDYLMWFIIAVCILWIVVVDAYPKPERKGFVAKSGVFLGVIRVIHYEEEEVAGLLGILPEATLYIVFKDFRGNTFVSEKYHSDRLPTFLRWILFSPKGYIHSIEGLKSFLEEYPPSRPAGICYWLDKVIKGMCLVEDAQDKDTYSYMIRC